AKKTLPANEGTVILAKALESAGLKAEAIGQVKAALAQQPSNTNARRQLIQQLSQSGRITEARAQLQQLIDQPGLADGEAVWARRTLAVNMTIPASVSAFQTSYQLIEKNRKQGSLSDDDRRALAVVYAAQRTREIEGKTARQHAIQLLSELT